MTSSYWLTRFTLQRGLGLIYFIGFLILVNQFVPLCGERGLLPARLFLKRVAFWDSPSIFQWYCPDGFLKATALVGLALSLTAVTGLCDAWNAWASSLTWLALWAIYLSFVNIGQTFWSFGWETLLVEAGFLAVFLGPSKSPPPVVVIWLFRWLAFRLMLGAGLIKLRGDSCWRDLTCMDFHFETQPMPNPLSWYFHQLPGWMHKSSVLLTHFVELVVPFGLFGPRPVRHFSGLATIAFQGILILSGNLAWLNWITIVVSFSCLDDGFWGLFLPRAAAWSLPIGAAAAGIPMPAIYGLAAVVAVLSVRPVMNMLSPRQAMNTSFEPLHLVNTYGAFGSVTRTRTEIAIEGTDDAVITPTTKWREYLFKGKPCETDRMPPVISPYHLHLDWQMWFAAMSSYQYNAWFVNLVAKLLRNDPAISGLLRGNPFPGQPPRYVRAGLYEYRFTRPGQPGWWTRERVAEYLPPLSLDDPQFRAVLQDQDWL